MFCWISWILASALRPFSSSASRSVHGVHAGGGVLAAQSCDTLYSWHVHMVIEPMLYTISKIVDGEMFLHIQGY